MIIKKKKSTQQDISLLLAKFNFLENTAKVEKKPNSIESLITLSLNKPSTRTKRARAEQSRANRNFVSKIIFFIYHKRFFY